MDLSGLATNETEPLLWLPRCHYYRTTSASHEGVAMTDNVNPLAGKPAPPGMLVNVAELVTAYFSLKPDPGVPSQRVAFGTSGHRGSAFEAGFNEAHILAIAQAVCDHRRKVGTDGPLFLGIDTHALSEPALASAIEVLAANGVETMIAPHGCYTPTPVVSHAILTHNRGRESGLADGIVISPSHNPPDEGGFKYNPTNGGPADVEITSAIQNAANDFLRNGLAGVERKPFDRARKAACVREHDYVTPYVADLGNVVDLDAVRSAGIRIGVDPLGGAAVQYWAPIAERYKIALTVVNESIDQTFRFMTLDWDGKIRMDCSSPYAMARLVAQRDKFDIAFANDTDADRHGIVCPSSGLMNPNHFLAVAISYLFAHREAWSATAAIGKTVVSSGIIDRVAERANRRLCEVPVGFKWFSSGLVDGSLGFGGEESAGASFLRRDGSVWTTDKDGPIMGLLAAEICARTGKDPGQLYDAITSELGQSFYQRIDAPASVDQKKKLARLDAGSIEEKQLAGDPVTAKLSTAPGNGEPIGGIKVASKGGWFAARPSGTEDVYKIYAESFVSAAHLRRIQDEARKLVDGVIG
jgi:phosphoglucomutase